jgi:hypothetical protein
LLRPGRITVDEQGHCYRGHHGWRSPRRGGVGRADRAGADRAGPGAGRVAGRPWRPAQSGHPYRAADRSRGGDDRPPRLCRRRSGRPGSRESPQRQLTEDGADRGRHLRRSRTGDPYRNPAINTNTSAAATASRHTSAGLPSRAGKYAMSVTASAALITASCAAATNERPTGYRCNSAVWDKNTRRGEGSLGITQHPSTHPTREHQWPADLPGASTRIRRLRRRDRGVDGLSSFSSPAPNGQNPVYGPGRLVRRPPGYGATYGR